MWLHTKAKANESCEKVTYESFVRADFHDDMAATGHKDKCKQQYNGYFYAESNPKFTLEANAAQWVQRISIQATKKEHERKNYTHN